MLAKCLFSHICIQQKHSVPIIYTRESTRQSVANAGYIWMCITLNTMTTCHTKFDFLLTFYTQLNNYRHKQADTAILNSRFSFSASIILWQTIQSKFLTPQPTQWKQLYLTPIYLEPGLVWGVRDWLHTHIISGKRKHPMQPSCISKLLILWEYENWHPGVTFNMLCLDEPNECARILP